MSYNDQYMQRYAHAEDPMLQKARRCPFCGSPALSFGRRCNYVHCDRCGADGPEIAVDRHAERGEIAQRAVDAWNQRFANDALEKQGEGP